MIPSCRKRIYGKDSRLEFEGLNLQDIQLICFCRFWLSADFICTFSFCWSDNFPTDAILILFICFSWIHRIICQSANVCCCDFYFENESLFIRLLTSFRPYHTIVVVFAQRTRRALFLFFLFLSAHHFWHQSYPPWPSKEIHFSLNAKQQWKGRHLLARVSVATDVTNMTSWGIRADQHTPWALRAVVNKKRFLGKFSYASDPTAPWHI